MLCDNLKKARVACGYTQSQISYALGIERSTYTCYETGKTRPDVQVIVSLATLYNMSVEVLVKEPLPGMLADGSDDIVDKLPNADRIYASLTDEERDIILRYRILKIQEKEEEIEKLKEILGEFVPNIE